VGGGGGGGGKCGFFFTEYNEKFNIHSIFTQKGCHINNKSFSTIFRYIFVIHFKDEVFIFAINNELNYYMKFIQILHLRKKY
jgi:hypothetical protein